MSSKRLRQLIDLSGLPMREIALEGRKVGLKLDHSRISRYCSEDRPIPNLFAEWAEPFLVAQWRDRVEKGKRLIDQSEGVADSRELATAGKE